MQSFSYFQNVMSASEKDEKDRDRERRSTMWGRFRQSLGPVCLSVCLSSLCLCPSVSLFLTLSVSVPLCLHPSPYASLPLFSVLCVQCLSIPVCLSISVFLCVLISAPLTLLSLPLSPTSLSFLSFLSIVFFPSFLLPLLFFLNYLEIGHTDIVILHPVIQTWSCGTILC